ncbi:hypothetical protein NEPAR06_0441 [Nematocida parisii]|nr:hypothetical protein NEPAR06_0441 [Nematocida parisii]KAI5156221.1 hypothetical protein NEPAR05_0398 [Nematocida parisii]
MLEVVDIQNILQKQITHDVISNVQYINNINIIYYYILMNININEILPNKDNTLFSKIIGYIYSKDIKNTYLDINKTNLDNTTVTNEILNKISKYIHKELNVYSTNNTISDKLYNSTEYNTHSTVSNDNSTEYNMYSTTSTINNTMCDNSTGYNTHSAISNDILSNSKYLVLYDTVIDTYTYNILHILLSYTCSLLKNNQYYQSVDVLPFDALYNDILPVSLHNYIINELNILYTLLRHDTAEEDLHDIFQNIKSLYYYYNRIMNIQSIYNIKKSSYIINYINNNCKNIPNKEIDKFLNNKNLLYENLNKFYNEFQYDTIIALIQTRTGSGTPIFDRIHKDDFLCNVLHKVNAKHTITYYTYYIIYSICISVLIGIGVIILLNNTLCVKYSSNYNTLYINKYMSILLIASTIISSVQLQTHLLNYKKSILSLLENEYDKLFMSVCVISIISISIFYINPLIITNNLFKLIITIFSIFNGIFCFFNNYIKKGNIFNYKNIIYTVIYIINILFITYLLYNYNIIYTFNGL